MGRAPPCANRENLPAIDCFDRMQGAAGLDDEEALTGDIIELARQCGRYGARLLDGEIVYSLHSDQANVESWRGHDNTVHPRDSINDKPPAPEVCVPAFAACAGYATPIISAGHVHGGVPSHPELTSARITRWDRSRWQVVGTI